MQENNKPLSWRAARTYGIRFDASPGVSRKRQLGEQLRLRIARGDIPAGTKLPSTRNAAGELGVSRSLLLEVYEQLTAEGYLEGRRGSGTYAAVIRIDRVRPGAAGERKNISRSAPRRPSRAPPTTAARVPTVSLIDFDRASGTPDPVNLPVKAWASCLKRAAETASVSSYSYSRGGDDERLTAALSDYLFRAKGIRCSPGQIMMTSGVTSGILFAGLFLASRFSRAYVENPSLPSIRNTVHHAGYRLLCLPVDRQGARPTPGLAEGDGGLILLTPSHQFPLGCILSVRRRLEFIECARRTQSIIIEDDYDGEFRLKGLPIPSLVSMDDRRIIHAATFSKTMFPSIRMGYLVLPNELLPGAQRFRRECAAWTNMINQRAMAMFIEEGRFERHVRRMRTLYAAKKDVLEGEVERAFGGACRVGGSDAGMHLTVELLDTRCRGIDWRGAASFGVQAAVIRQYAMRPTERGNTLVLGYGDLSPDEIREGVRRLKRFIQDATRGRGLS